MKRDWTGQLGVLMSQLLNQTVAACDRGETEWQTGH